MMGFMFMFTNATTTIVRMMPNNMQGLENIGKDKNPQQSNGYMFVYFIHFVVWCYLQLEHFPLIKISVSASEYP